MTGESARDAAAVARLATRLRDDLGLDAILVKLSEEGMLLLPKGGESRKIAARAREVFDVSGAGDTVIATCLLARAAGATVTEAAMLGNYAAGVVVGKLGTATCTPAELLENLARDRTEGA